MSYLGNMVRNVCGGEYTTMFGICDAQHFKSLKYSERHGGKWKGAIKKKQQETTSV